MKEPSENALRDHPSEEALIAVILESMKAEEAEQILLHLDSCPVCERRLEAIEPLLCRYRDIRAESFAKPPSWRGLEDAMDRMDARKPPSQVRRPAWTGLIAAGVALCVFLLWPTGRQAELRAGTLLRDAQRSEAAGGLKRRLEVRTAAGSFVRPAVLNGKLAVDAVGARFISARYDWSDPLAPVSYSKWQDTLKSKKVEVAERDGQARIQTNTSEGELVEASFTIAENNMRVISGRFRFSDRLWVEIAAIPDTTESAASVVSATPAAPSVRFIHSLAERELHVWAAIDRMNLGAGAPISVDPGPGDRIMITAYQLPDSQERELRTELSSIEGVTLERGESNNGERTVSPMPVDSAIEISESIVSRTHLLDRLADRFPPSTEEGFTLPDRRILWEMRTRNVALIEKDINALGKKLPKALSTQPGVSAARPSTQAMVESATIVDRLVTILFTAAGSDQDRSRLREEFSKLRETAVDYSRSLGEEPSR